MSSNRSRHWLLTERTVKVFLPALLLLVLPLNTQGFLYLDQLVSDTLQEAGGVGLTAWSVDSNANICSLGVAGERIKGSGGALATKGDSRHHIGSVTKSMTATLLAIMIEEAKQENNEAAMARDATTSSSSDTMMSALGVNGWNTYLKELLDFAEGTAYEDITLRELVGMISGIPSTIDLKTLPDHDETLRSQRRAAAIAALQASPVGIPGQVYEYSNYAFLLAGHIIEELTGQTWEDVLADRLFLPLGIELGTRQNYVGASKSIQDPWGHSGMDLEPCDPTKDLCDNTPALGPAGTFSGPVHAMARYLSWHMQCHNDAIPADDTGATNLLSPEACKGLHQPANASVSVYGYGWLCYHRGGGNGSIGYACDHNGSNNLHYYNATLAFEKDRVYVGYTNGFRPDWQDGIMVNEIVQQVSAISDADNCTAPFESTTQPSFPSDDDDGASGAATAPRIDVVTIFVVSALAIIATIW